MLDSQVKEFQETIVRLDSYAADIKSKTNKIGELERQFDELRADNKRLRKLQLSSGVNAPIRWIGNTPLVSDDCAESVTATFVVECERTGGALASLIRDGGARQRVVDKAHGILGMGFGSTRTALNSSTTPLPTAYVPQVVELQWKYGQGRQHATVHPLGAGTVKLPRLKAGEDDFGYIGAGTAGMSQPVLEKQVTAELVTFTANKCGGLIRIPTEIEEDTFIPLAACRT